MYALSVLVAGLVPGAITCARRRQAKTTLDQVVQENLETGGR